MTGRSTRPAVARPHGVFAQQLASLVVYLVLPLPPRLRSGIRAPSLIPFIASQGSSLLASHKQDCIAVVYPKYPLVSFLRIASKIIISK